MNINGLLNAYDVTDVIALDCECVNAESTKELYELALKKHPNAKNILYPIMLATITIKNFKTG